jgi:hypothetical protein
MKAARIVKVNEPLQIQELQTPHWSSNPDRTNARIFLPKIDHIREGD